MKSEGQQRETLRLKAIVISITCWCECHLFCLLFFCCFSHSDWVLGLKSRESRPWAFMYSFINHRQEIHGHLCFEQEHHHSGLATERRAVDKNVQRNWWRILLSTLIRALIGVVSKNSSSWMLDIAGIVEALLPRSKHKSNPTRNFLLPCRFLTFSQSLDLRLWRDGIDARSSRGVSSAAVAQEARVGLPFSSVSPGRGICVLADSKSANSQR